MTKTEKMNQLKREKSILLKIKKASGCEG